MTSTSETPPGTNGFALPPRVAQQKYRVAQSNVPNDRATRDHLKDLTIGEYIRFEGRHIVINTRLPAKY